MWRVDRYGAGNAGQHGKQTGSRYWPAMARRHCVSVLGVICSGVFGAGLAMAPAVAAAALSLPAEGLPGEGLFTLAAAAGLGCTSAPGLGFADGSAAGGGLAANHLSAKASGFFFCPQATSRSSTAHPVRPGAGD